MTNSSMRLYGLCGILSTFLYMSAYVIGALLRPGYSSISQATSELLEVGAPNMLLLGIMIFSFHALLLPFAYGLHKAIDGGKGSKAGPVLLATAGIMGMVLTVFFPCDKGCNPVTITGIMHIIIAIPMGFISVFSILAFSRRLKGNTQWVGFDKYSMITFVVSILLAIATSFLAKSGYGGFLQRILGVAYMQWWVVMGIALIKRSFQKEQVDQ